MVNFFLVSVHLCVNQLLSKVLTSLACFKVPRGNNQGLELFCLLIGNTMGQEAERQRVAWQMLSNATSGGGHRLPTGLLIAFMVVSTNDNHANYNGFTALSKRIGTSKLTERDSDYVVEHSVLKHLRGKIACYRV